MIVRGIDIAEPGLNVGGLLLDQAKALYPEIDQKCLGDLGAPDSFGGLAPADLFRADAPLDAVVAALNANDPETLTIRGPVRIEQGKADTTVFPNFTDQLGGELKGRGVDGHLQDLRRRRPRRRGDRQDAPPTDATEVVATSRWSRCPAALAIDWM